MRETPTARQRHSHRQGAKIESGVDCPAERYIVHTPPRCASRCPQLCALRRISLIPTIKSARDLWECSPQHVRRRENLLPKRSPARARERWPRTVVLSRGRGILAIPNNSNTHTSIVPWMYTCATPELSDATQKADSAGTQTLPAPGLASAQRWRRCLAAGPRPLRSGRGSRCTAAAHAAPPGGATQSMEPMHTRGAVRWGVLSHSSLGGAARKWGTFITRQPAAISWRRLSRVGPLGTCWPSRSREQQKCVGPSTYAPQHAVSPHPVLGGADCGGRTAGAASTAIRIARDAKSSE